MATHGAEEVDKWHRWFAVECNNRAIDLIALPKRTADEDAEMLATAYAAAFHWSKVGQPINAARADHVLSGVFAALGDAPRALHHGHRYLDFCRTGPCEDWDGAFAHAAVAMAAAVGDERVLHADHYRRAEEAGRGITEADDREAFFNEFARVPKPV